MNSINRIRFSPKNRKECIALANSGGGFLNLGLGDDGKLIGFRKTDRLKKEIISVLGTVSGLNLLEIEETWDEEKKRFALKIHIAPAAKWLSLNHQGFLLIHGEIYKVFRDEWEEWVQGLGKEFFENGDQSHEQCLVLWCEFQKKRQPFRRDAKGEKLPEIDLDNSPRNVEIIRTGDGSSSLYFRELDETYHSHQGAVEESKWVFIQMGLMDALDRSTNPRILEVGFGTGLNAGLCLETLRAIQRTAVYHTLEPYPLKIDLVRQLQYEVFWSTETHKNWELMHQLAFERAHFFPAFLEFQKFKTKVQAFAIPDKYDVIFFDAFAPNKQSELWSVEVLTHCRELLKSGGTLVTYCANGQFKRNLKAAGFQIDLLAGPPGRREMVRGIN